MHRIEIDDAVYGLLEAHVRGFEQPNDVLRRLLNMKEDAAVPTPDAGTYKSGKLGPLIDAGFIKPGDSLTHHQSRRGNTFNAVVEADGWIRTDVKRYQSPSPALAELVGSSIDGWAHWTHVESGKSLRALREGLGRLRAV